AATVAAPDRDQALRLQDPQRFPQRDQADVELFDQHLLARQQVAVGEFAVDDLAAQLVGHDFGDPRRRQSATGVGANTQGGHSNPRNKRTRLFGYLSSNGINSRAARSSLGPFVGIGSYQYVRATGAISDAEYAAKREQIIADI